MKACHAIFIGLTINLLAVSCNPAPSKQTQVTAEDEEAMTMLKEFYTQYLKLWNATDMDIAKEEEIRKKFCSADYLKGLQNRIEEPDADPLVCAQDTQEHWVDNISISPNGKANSYKVCFPDSYSQNTHCITVSVIKEDGSWKIKGTDCD